MYELVSFSKYGKKYRQFIFDLILRNNSGSPIRYEAFSKVDELHEMGFDSELLNDVQLKSSTMTNILKSFGRAY